MKYYKVLGLAPDSKKGDDAVYRCLDTTGTEVLIHKQFLVKLWKCGRIIKPSDKTAVKGEKQQ